MDANAQPRSTEHSDWNEKRTKQQFRKALHQPTEQNWNAFIESAVPFAINRAKRSLPKWSQAGAEVVAYHAIDKLIRAASRFDPDRNLRVWLAAFVYNEAMNLLRAEQRWNRQFSAEGLNNGTKPVNPSEIADHREIEPLKKLIRDENQRHDSNRLRAVMFKLTPCQRVVLSMRFDGASNTDIAAELKMSPGSVATCLCRAVQLARELLGVDPSSDTSD
jgi:RNA polymerase sigma factor (sigma-70 family)